MKMSDIKNTNRRIEIGAWVGELPNLPGVSLKVRGTFNSDYNRMLGKLRNEMSNDDWDNPEVQATIEATLLVETVLIDWNGIEDAPFSKETALQWLQDPEMAIFKRAVNYAAANVVRDGRDTLEADAKN